MFNSKETLHQTLASIPVCLAKLIMGIHFGWMPMTLVLLKNQQALPDLVVTSDQCSWIASLHLIGRAVGPIICSPFVNMIGRSKQIFLISILSFMMWPTLLYYTSVPVLYAVRTLVGLAVGILDVMGPIYIAENCSPKMRAIVNILFYFFFLSGQLLAFIVPYLASYHNTLRIYSVISGVVLISAFLLKEPAQFLIQDNKIEKAEKNFFWLRGQKAKAELEAIKKNVFEEKDKTSFSQLLTSPENYRSLRVVTLMNFICMFSGYTAVVTFAPMMFTSGKYFSTDELQILFGFIQLCSMVATSFIIERFRRRTLTLVMAAACMVVQASTAALYYVNSNIMKVPYFEWWIFGTMTGYASIYGMTFLPVLSLLRGELLPQSIKSYGSTAAIIANSLAGFSINKIFLGIAQTYGTEMNFAAYSVMSFVMFVYIYIDLPETKNKTLTEIQDEFKEDMEDLKKKIEMSSFL